MLTLDNLKVYDKALTLAAGAEALTAAWGRRHAIVGHFRRASESIVLNLAEAARLRPGADKVRTLEYAVGSSLECAACLDLARVKQCLHSEQCVAEKKCLLEISRMLIGLRKGWLGSMLREEPKDPPVEDSAGSSEVLFHHESLDVYQVGLDFMRWFLKLPGGKELADRGCREIDKSATSVVLNIAEGNGRYSELDHRRFLEIAAASAVKVRVHLDIHGRRRLAACLELTPGREFLNRIVAMLSRF